MSNRITINTKGLDDLAKKLNGLDLSKDIVSPRVEAYGFNVVSTAKLLAPVDTGNMRRNISNQKLNDLTQKIIAQARYSAFVEFGTGPQVDVPRELQDVAIQFKGKRKLPNGQKPQPYIYPALLDSFTKFKIDLRRAFSDYKL